MFNSATPTPSTPPNIKITQKEQDAANSLMELQKNYTNPNDSSKGRTSTGINSPVHSPIEKINLTSTDTNDNAVLLNQNIPNTLDTPKSSAHQEPLESCFESVLLPPIYGQRESAVRSTLDRSLPVFGSLFRQEDEELRRESTTQNDLRIQLKQAQQASRDLYEERRGNEGSQQQYPRQPCRIDQFNQYTHQEVQAQSQAQAHDHAEHAHAQAYYLAQAHIRTYGHPQQQIQRNSQQPQPQQQHQHKKQQQQQQHHRHYHKQPLMNHHVRAVQDRRISLPWTDAINNRKGDTLDSSGQTAMQNSFSINGDGVRIQRSILNNGPSAASVSSVSPSHQRQIKNNIGHGNVFSAYMVGQSPPQQVGQQQAAQKQAVQHQAPHPHSREAQMQAAQRNLDQQGMSHGRLSLNPIIVYHPLDPRQIHPSDYTAKQIYNQRESLQQQAYRHHQQMHEQAIQLVNRKFQHIQHQQEQKLQQQQQQQQKQSMSQQSPNYETVKATFQQVMHQGKVVSRQRRETNANNDSPTHRLSRQPQSQPKPQQHQEEEEARCAVTISPATTSDTLMTTEAEDEEMYEGEEDEYYNEEEEEEEEGEHRGQEISSASDPDSQGSSNIDKSATKTNKKGKGAVKEKPRWTPQLRETLLKAVIAYKNLDDMTSFHWCQIGKQVGRSGKACKDQWRRALLPKIQQTFDRYDQDYSSAFSASSQQQHHYQQQQQQSRNINQDNKN